MTLLDQLTDKWKSASGEKKLIWLAIASPAAYLVSQFKIHSGSKFRRSKKRNSNKD